MSEKRNSLNKIKKLKEAYQQISREDIDKIEAILPEEGGEDKLLAELEDIVLGNGLILSSLQIEKKGAEPINKSIINNFSGEIGKIKIGMDIVGTDYVGLKNFLTVIEKNLRLIDIIKIGFSPAENKTSIEAYSYYLIKK